MREFGSSKAEKEKISALELRVIARPSILLSAPDFTHDYRSKQVPASAFKAHRLYLLKWEEISRADVDLDARQEHSELNVLQVCRLLHDIRSRKFVATLCQDLHERLRCIALAIV